MSIPGCNCARCLQGYPHRDPYETPAPIVDEAAFSAAMDRVDAFQRAQEPAPELHAAFNALLREIKTLHDSKGADYEDGGKNTRTSPLRKMGHPGMEIRHAAHE